MTEKMSLSHAMTVDVEDYFHVAAFAKNIRTTEWDDYPLRVRDNTERLLTLFERKGIKATFFVLGWVAERAPDLVKLLSDAGHEIASHGYSHQLIYTQTPEVFREETYKSKSMLEDIIQRPVNGYRAASYSITHKSLWALDILADLGFVWDSSIFPIRHDNYGIVASPKRPYLIETNFGPIRELPLTTANVMGMSIPAAGGGYFRQFPYALYKWLFAKAASDQRAPQIFYLHPWEVDPSQPKIEGASWFSRFRHYTNLDKCYARLERLLDDFRFTTVSESFASVSEHKQLKLNELLS